MQNTRDVMLDAYLQLAEMRRVLPGSRLQSSVSEWRA
jgi:hypothetical protein